jgi:hypothetical protein
LVEGSTPRRADRARRHAQRARERLEDGLALVVRVVAAQVVDVHRGLRVVHEALEEFVREVDVELAHARARELARVLEARAGRRSPPRRARAPRRAARRRAVAADALLVASALASAMPSVMPMSSTVWCASISRSPLRAP